MSSVGLKYEPHNLYSNINDIVFDNECFLESMTQNNSSSFVGSFECRYHPYLKSESATIKDVCPSFNDPNFFGNIRTVTLHEATNGLAHEQVVAIFPENFKNVTPSKNHPVFYFVDKFTLRHIKNTRKFLNLHPELDVLFKPILNLETSELHTIISNWVNVHEMSHRTGNMPLPLFLKEKSGMFTAALEELRADLKVLLYCSRKFDSDSFAEKTFLYVLAERLFSYPLFRVGNNFDCISSILLWKFISSEGVDFKINCDLNLLSKVIESLLNKIDSFEILSLDYDNVIDRKNSLTRSVLGYLGNYEHEYQQYLNRWSRN